LGTNLAKPERIVGNQPAALTGTNQQPEEKAESLAVVARGEKKIKGSSSSLLPWIWFFLLPAEATG
jgi:hypothetical protein